MSETSQRLQKIGQRFYYKDCTEMYENIKAKQFRLIQEIRLLKKVIEHYDSLGIVIRKPKTKD